METKRCSRCKLEKTVDSFLKRETYKMGIDSQCKSCHKIQVRNYSRTVGGLITMIYAHQKSSANKRGYGLPFYSKQELKNWITSCPSFYETYNKWVESNYVSSLRPSVDRIDDYKGYSLDNIQLMTWGDNRRKGHADQKCGINNKLSKAVIQYSLDGELIGRYYSIKDASRKTGVKDSNISGCCKHKKEHLTRGGFIWEYAESISKERQ